MKLIQILALATTISLAAGAQNAGTKSGQPAAQPSPLPKAQGVPAAGKASPTPAATSKNGASATAGKPAISTGTVKDKPNQNTVKAAPSPAKSAATSNSATKAGAKASASNAKGGPAPNSTKAVAPASATSPAAQKKSTPTAAPNAAAQKKGAPTPAPTAATQKTGTPGADLKTTAPKPAKAATGSAAAKKSNSKQAQPAAAKPKVEKPKAEPAKPEKAKTEAPAEKRPTRLVGAAGRRDPFVSPIRDRNNVAPTASCTSGKRCLAIPELVLQGTVRDISGKMMAVVSTSNRRTYTLRENDQVFNGSVEKITSDSIIFREYVKDAVGRESAKEVVKKLGPTS
jgi:hypothetical protein